MHRCVHCLFVPAVTFFRVNVNLSMTGSPREPQEIIKTWVRNSYNCIQKLHILKGSLKLSCFSRAKGERKAGSEQHDDRTECHHTGGSQQVGLFN